VEWSGVERAPKLRRARDVKGAAQTWGNSATNDAIRCDARCEAMGGVSGGATARSAAREKGAETMKP
jgi:hypothetical protein